MKTILRVAPVTGLIGTMIGIIPGAGADIGSFVGYNTARGMSKHPELFGKGSPEAVASGGRKQRCYRRCNDPDADTRCSW